MIPDIIKQINQEDLGDWKLHPVTRALFRYYSDLINAMMADIHNRIFKGEPVSEEEQKNLYVIKETLVKQVIEIRYDDDGEGRFKTICELYGKEESNAKED